MISFSSQLVLAQIGLGQGAAGGFVVLLIVGALALMGLVLAVVFGISLFRAGATRSRDLVLLLVGIALVSPAVWLAGAVFVDLIPRRKSWDLSASRSTTLLGEKNDTDPELRERIGYTYSGNIQSSVKLSANRQWSGRAQSVYFRVKAGEITSIQWQSPQADATHIREEAQRILKELAMGAQAERDLDAWYANIGRAQRAYFSAETQLEPGARIQVMVTRVPRDAPKEPLWTVDVDVRWNEPQG